MIDWPFPTKETFYNIGDVMAELMLEDEPIEETIEESIQSNFEDAPI